MVGIKHIAIVPKASGGVGKNTLYGQGLVFVQFHSHTGSVAYLGHDLVTVT